ncbi:MAG: hypothetical protein IPH38_01725 [Candidatus Microthrix sp.]|nr:hypothetical protein [Candidatus Microthrix sp.]MBK7018331.1 hypothetical protein [Candidatus Microthrix sp.]
MPCFADGPSPEHRNGARDIVQQTRERPGSLLPSLPLPEQRAIADYLDAETARIDALITKKRRMIDLLGEAALERDHLAWTGGSPKVPVSATCSRPGRSCLDGT